MNSPFLLYSFMFNWGDLCHVPTNTFDTTYTVVSDWNIWNIFDTKSMAYAYTRLASDTQISL